MKIINFLDKELKIALFELQENTQREYNEIGKRLHEQKEKFNRARSKGKKEPNRNSGAK